jgi:hypothetical protein
MGEEEGGWSLFKCFAKGLKYACHATDRSHDEYVFQHDSRKGTEKRTREQLLDGDALLLRMGRYRFLPISDICNRYKTDTQYTDHKIII